MPDHEDSLGGETLDGEEQQDPAEQSLGDGATMGGDTAAHSLGDQSTFGDANVDDELFDDGMELVDLSTRYTEEGVLGKGGFGEVVLATDTRLGRKVAIKRIQGKAARSKTAVQRFLTEAKSIAVLSHTNIVQIYEYGRSIDGPFLIMECVQGGSLLDRCRKGPIDLDEAVNIFSQVCDGLAKAHAAGIIHRDIKPANVLLTEDGVPKLTDFGLAKDDTADTGITMEGAVIGTLDFMPPEQRQAAEFTDHRSDLWSLAATFYQMLTGKSPKVINISSIPPKLQSVVAKALEQSKEDRFQSAMEMREAILQAHSGKMDTSRSLGEGECPQCAIPNPPYGKFCVECSAVLQVPCLNCEAQIQIWNKACGECGSNQTGEIEKLSVLMQHRMTQATKLLDNNRHIDALHEIEELSIPIHPLASHLLEMQTAWQQKIQAVFTEKQQQSEDRFRSVKQLEVVREYSQIISVLETIPKEFRTTQISDYLQDALVQRKRIQTLREQLLDYFSEYKKSRARHFVKWETTIVGFKDTIIALEENLDQEFLDYQGAKKAIKQIKDLETFYSEARIAQEKQEYEIALEKIISSQSIFTTDKGDSIRRTLEETLDAGRELIVEINNEVSSKRFESALELLKKYRSDFSSGASFSGLDEPLKDSVELSRKFGNASLSGLSLVDLRSFCAQFESLADYLTCDGTKKNIAAIRIRINEIEDDRFEIVREYNDLNYIGLLEPVNKLRPFLREDELFTEIFKDLDSPAPCLNIHCHSQIKKGDRNCVVCGSDQQLKCEEVNACLASSYQPSRIGEAIVTHNILLFVLQQALEYHDRGYDTVFYPQEGRINNKIAGIYKKWFSYLIKNAKSALALYRFDEVIKILPLTINLTEADEIRKDANYGNEIMSELVERYHSTKDQLKRKGILQECLRIFPGHLPIQARLQKHEKIQLMLQQRQALLVEQNIVAASEIRDDLVKMGVAIKDVPEGTQWTDMEDNLFGGQ
jgi:serine/threonine-protein kinase